VRILPEKRALLWNIWGQLLAENTYNISPVKWHAVSAPGFSTTHNCQIYKVRKTRIKNKAKRR
jgi:hypothetical protein